MTKEVAEKWAKWEGSFHKLGRRFVCNEFIPELPGKFNPRWVKTDCVHYDVTEDDKCDALADSYCGKGHQCPFYKEVKNVYNRY